MLVADEFYPLLKNTMAKGHQDFPLRAGHGPVKHQQAPCHENISAAIGHILAFTYS